MWPAAPILPFEGAVIAYFIFFAVAAPLTGVGRARRMRTTLTALTSVAAVYSAAQLLPLAARLWLPFLYIALGYWMPVPLVPSRRGGAFETWLLRTDAAFRGVAFAVPRWLLHVAEVAYLMCFPLVPASFAVVWLAGTQDDVARYWLAVLVAGYACYVTLPWLVSRPPRLLEGSVPSSTPTAVSQANVFVLGRVSHQLNTFPSGHVAVSFAAAIGAGEISTPAGLVFGLIATGVAIGAVVGRYHFVVDVLLGVAIGVAAAWLVGS